MYCSGEDKPFDKDFCMGSDCSEPKGILALNTNGGTGAMFIMVNGYKFDKKRQFTFGKGTSVQESCSVMWKNVMYVYG